MRNDNIFDAAIFAGKKTADIAKESGISPSRTRQIILKVAMTRSKEKFEEIRDANINAWGGNYVSVKALRDNADSFRSIKSGQIDATDTEAETGA